MDKDKSRTIFDTARDVAVVATVYLFFAGFLYQYFWYQSLGVPFNESQFSFNALLVFAYYAFADNVGAVMGFLVFAAIAALIWIAVAQRLKLALEHRALGFRILAGLFCVALFPLLYGWSHSATYQAINKPLLGDSQTLVTFVLDDKPKGKYDHDFMAANNGRLTLVSVSADYYYALEIPEQSLPCGRIPHTYVFAVRKDDVVSMKTFIPARIFGKVPYDTSKAPNC